MEELCRGIYRCGESLFYTIKPKIKFRVERERSHWRTKCQVTVMVLGYHSAEAEGPGPTLGRRMDSKEHNAESPQVQMAQSSGTPLLRGSKK